MSGCIQEIEKIIHINCCSVTFVSTFVIFLDLKRCDCLQTSFICILVMSVSDQFILCIFDVVIKTRPMIYRYDASCRWLELYYLRCLHVRREQLSTYRHCLVPFQHHCLLCILARRYHSLWISHHTLLPPMQHSVARWYCFRWCRFVFVSMITPESFEISLWNFYGSKIWSKVRSNFKMAAVRRTAVRVVT